MKYGFLFGAGAEVSYGLPSGGQFALDIFRHDSSESKKEFKTMRNSVDITTRYASFWMPKGFQDKSISSFGKSVFQNVIKDTVEHNRVSIIEQINKFDTIARKEAERLQQKDGLDVNQTISKLLHRDIDDIHMGQKISFIREFEEGNELFDNSYFAALLLIYKDKTLIDREERAELGKIILSILQLHIGALSEKLSRKINDGLFDKKDDDIDLLDDIGEIIQLNYATSGVAGMEYLLEKKAPNIQDEAGIILCFAQRVIESIYSSVLGYKSLIDANWHYLYSPSSDWAKFCKICIFLLTVRDYIISISNNVKPLEQYGYYHMLKEAQDAEMFEISAVATTNYNQFIEKILELDVAFLNGSTELWYDPYLNRMGKREELLTNENHILVPLMFTQSGTKPMTSIEMSMRYVETYIRWRASDAIVVVGFGFGIDDEHINGVLRTLVDVDDKHLIVVLLDEQKTDVDVIREITNKLKVSKKQNIHVVQVDSNGILKNTTENWCHELNNVLEGKTC